MFHLDLSADEGLIGSIIRLLGLDLDIPDHSTLSRRAKTLQVLRAPSRSAPLHLLVDSTGLRLSGPGEWLVEKHGARAGPGENCISAWTPTLVRSWRVS